LPAGPSERVHYSCLSHVHMSYLSRSDNRLSVWWKVNTIKIFIVYFSPVLCHFLLGPNTLHASTFSFSFNLPLPIMWQD
jgi:hypothetical protein